MYVYYYFHNNHSSQSKRDYISANMCIIAMLFNKKKNKY